MIHVYRCKCSQETRVQAVRIYSKDAFQEVHESTETINDELTLVYKPERSDFEICPWRIHHATLPKVFAIAQPEILFILVRTEVC